MRPLLIISIVLLAIACNEPEHKKAVVIASNPVKISRPDSGEHITSLRDSGALIHLLYPKLNIVGSIGYCKSKGDTFSKFWGTSVLSINKVLIDSLEHYLVTFKTIPYEEIGREDESDFYITYIGLAEMIKINSYYEIIAFKERADSMIGYWPVISIRRTGLSKCALSITYSWGMGAREEKTEMLYQISGEAKIFSYQPINDFNLIIYYNWPLRSTHKVLNMVGTYLPHFLSPEYYELNVVSTIHKYNSKKNREDETIESEFYRMDINKNRYVKDSLFYHR